jgi:hypothetical protein
MSLYSNLREANSSCFNVRLEANIDLCETCIVKNEKSLEHCGDCEIYLSRKKKIKWD